MSPQERKASAREALLDAARELFTAKGYDAVSTREVAEAAGVNLGCIQYHFGSKAKLFAETVTTVMEGGQCTRAQEALDDREIESVEDAGRRLTVFVRMFLEFVLQRSGPKPCRMMFREVFTETSADPEMFEALTTSVVRDFIKPVDDRLMAVLRHLMPKAGQTELELTGHSVIGQCSFYLTHGPFVQRLRGRDFSTPEALDEVAGHIAAFTLRAIGYDDKFIHAAREESSCDACSIEEDRRKHG